MKSVSVVADVQKQLTRLAVAKATVVLLQNHLWEAELERGIRSRAGVSLDSIDLRLATIRGEQIAAEERCVIAERALLDGRAALQAYLDEVKLNEILAVTKH